MKVLCAICARGGSKGVKNKNIKKLNGIPLIAHTIFQAKKSRIFTKIVVSTDSKKIQNISKKFGAETWFLRPKHLSSDKSEKQLAVRHLLISAEKYYKIKFDVIVDLDATSPLRKINDIKLYFKKFKDTKSDVLFTICESKKNPYFNMVEIINNKIRLVKRKANHVLRRQDAPKVYDLGCDSIQKREIVLKKGRKDLFTQKTSYYLMPSERSVDIDTKHDWKLINFLINNTD